MRAARYSTIFTIYLASFAGTAIGSSEAEDVTVLRNADIVDVAGARVLEDRTVFIRGERIDAIMPPSASVQSDATVIDVQGLFLMPALIDSHVHLNRVEIDGPALVANGVLAVRDMGGPTEVRVELRDQLNSRSVFGPRMIVSGAIVDGDPPVWPFSEAVDTPDAGRAAVDKLADAGVDFIKVYSRLKPDVFLAICEQAKKRGLLVVGHVPDSVSIWDAAAAGQKTGEHLIGLVKEIDMPETADDRPMILRMMNPWPLLERADDQAIDDMLAKLAASDMVQCPTAIVMRGIAQAADPPTRENEPMLAYVDDVSLAFWGGGNYGVVGAGIVDSLGIMNEFVGRMHRAGVPMVVGTDLANPYVYPGFAVHDEMEIWAGAGIPPADVLRSATSGPADLFGWGEDLGTIEAGKEASFSLVRGNPLVDIANARLIEHVFLAGDHFDREALDSMLAEARSAANPPPAVVDADAPEGFTVGFEPEGEVLHAGRFEFKFEAFPAGYEAFMITRVRDGYRIYAEFRPGGGMQIPSFSTYELDAAMAVQRATYRSLRGDDPEAVYERRGETLVATSGDDTAELPLNGRQIVTGPNTVTAIILHAAAKLEPGDEITETAAAFGVMGWQPMPWEITVARLDDATAELDGAEVPVRVYRWAYDTPQGKFTDVLRVDFDGLLLESALSMPFGNLTTKRATGE